MSGVSGGWGHGLEPARLAKSEIVTRIVEVAQKVVAVSVVDQRLEFADHPNLGSALQGCRNLIRSPDPDMQVLAFQFTQGVGGGLHLPQQTLIFFSWVRRKYASDGDDEFGFPLRKRVPLGEGVPLPRVVEGPGGGQGDQQADAPDPWVGFHGPRPQPQGKQSQPHPDGGGVLQVGGMAYPNAQGKGQRQP